MPDNYKPGIPRVSQIVSHFYPFIGEPMERFKLWLSKNGVEYDDYMKEASEGGTYVHNQLEQYVKLGKNT